MTADQLPNLLGPARFARVAVVITVVLLTGCIADALLLAQPRLDQAIALVRRLRISDLCLTPSESARHPGWAREDQARAGQPYLPDPRGPASIAHVVPLKVQR